jgi:hypothetical protein
MLEQSDLERSDIIIRQRDGVVIAAIPQFGLFAQAGAMQAALEALESKKEAFAADLAAFEHFNARPANEARKSESIRWQDIKQFAVKAAIVFGLFIAFVLFFTIQAHQVIRSTVNDIQARIERVPTIGGRKFWENAEQALERLSDARNDLPAEKKQKLLTEVRTIVERWRPFVNEALKIFPLSPALERQQTSPGDR